MMKRNRVLVLFVIAEIAFSAIPQTTRANTIKTMPAEHSITTPGDPRTLQEEIELSQNQYVRNYIKAFLSQKDRFGRMLGLSKYYFPIYEKVFREHQMPDELKYISVIESALNPYAISKAGAAGPWQFLNEVGKKYGLTVNDSIDERRDPLLACHAAADYLLESYKMYGKNWLLAVASYNCGRNNIKWAIEEAGGKTDYWSIRKFLPAETQSYVPAFLATIHIMNNYVQYGIEPGSAEFPVETKAIQLKKQVSLEAIAKAANISLDQLCTLNPAYVKLLIYASESAPKNLILPVLPGYAYNAVCVAAGLPVDTSLPAPPKVIKYYIFYRVQEGDTFASIAEKFKNTETDIKTINKLADGDLKTGMTIKIGQS